MGLGLRVHPKALGPATLKSKNRLKTPKSGNPNCLLLLSPSAKARKDLSQGTGAVLNPQELQYPLIKEYTLNSSRIPNMI